LGRASGRGRPGADGVAAVRTETESGCERCAALLTLQRDACAAGMAELLSRQHLRAACRAAHAFALRSLTRQVNFRSASNAMPAVARVYRRRSRPNARIRP